MRQRRRSAAWCDLFLHIAPAGRCRQRPGALCTPGLKLASQYNEHLVPSVPTCRQLRRQTYQHRQDGAQHGADLRTTSSHCLKQTRQRNKQKTNKFVSRRRRNASQAGRAATAAVCSQSAAPAGYLGLLVGFQQLASSSRPAGLHSLHFPTQLLLLLLIWR